MRRLASVAVVALAAVLALPAAAQDRAESLADIRQQLGQLSGQIQQLRSELVATGGAQAPAGGGSVLDRVAAMEAELSRLTSKTEELENRINRIVTDGTNRLGDLEFRLVELEGGDIAAIGQTPTLGGGAAPVAPAPVLPPAGNGGAQLAVSERADFDRAKAAFDAGDYFAATGLFQTFTETYTGGPLTGEAHFWRGEALARNGQTAPAARAFLESFSGSPGGALAPRALYRLGQSLGELGQLQEACVTLGEVGLRFPGDPAVTEAEAHRRALGCQ